MKKLIVSASPHIRGADSTSSIMWMVVKMLIPAGIMGVVIFGLYSLYVITVCVVTAVLTEAICNILRKRPVTIFDGSAVITGLLIAYTLPPTVPLWVSVIGTVFAIAIVKHTFGGLGNNIWNPALAGRAFLQVSFPNYINSGWLNHRQISDGVNDFVNRGVDAITRATPLVQEVSEKVYSHLDLLTGNTPGCIGEVSAVAIVITGLYLIYRGYVDWIVPAGFIGTVALLSYVLPTSIDTVWANDPLYHILAGGVMLGAFFMATDMVTTPLTRKGLLVFGIGCGLLTVLIRFYGGYPEGVCYSILIMNTATPLIDRFTKPKLLGGKGGKK